MSAAERLRDLVADADDIAAEINDIRQELAGAADENRQRAGYPLAALAEQASRMAKALSAIVDDVERTDTLPTDACGLPWGVCPEHGNSLSSSGGTTWCTALGCERMWAASHVSGPCPEAVTATVVDQAGTPVDLCHGHALAALVQMPTATVTTITK